MSEELELISHGLDKVINKLQKLYPNHDFTKKSKPRKKHFCSLKNDNPKEYATDMEGNDFCIQQYKEVTEENYHIYKIKTCYAIIRTAKQKELMKKGAF